MSESATEVTRIVDRLPIHDKLRLSAHRWHEQRRARSPVDDSWVELVCTYAEDPDGRDTRIRLVVPSTPAAVGDAIELHDTEWLGMIPPSMPAHVIGQLLGEPADRGTGDSEDRAFTQLLLAHRLERGERVWIAHVDRPADGAYEALLGQLEAVYPDNGDPETMASVGRAALSHLGEVAELATRHGSSLEPESNAGVIWRVSHSPRLVVMPLLVVLQWGLATRDRVLLAELRTAARAYPELAGWQAAASTVLERLDTVDRIFGAIGDQPGVLQSTLATQLGLEKDLVREVLWVLQWARVVRREKDGRSYRLYLA